MCARRMVCLVLAAVPVFVGCGHTQAPGAASSLADGRLEAAVDSIVVAHLGAIRVPGMSVAILRGDAVLLAKGYGRADLEKGTSPKPETVYRIGSLTKQFTAVAVMRLVEEGRVLLDAPVSRYVPGYPASSSTPSVRSLLLQTAGMPDFDEFPERERAVDLPPLGLDGVAALIAKNRPKFGPDTWWAYSNSNYALLATLIEHVSGRSYDQFVSEAVLRPARLRATGRCDALPEELPRAIGYEFDDGAFTVRRVAPNVERFYVGSGHLCSHVLDLASWTRALIAGRIISVASYRTMLTPRPLPAGFTPPYGFGLSLISYHGHRSVSHSGFLGGFSTMLAYFPDDDIIVAVAANGRHAHVQHTLKAIAGAALGLAPAAALADVPIAEDALRQYAGTYDDGLFRIQLVVEAGRLALQIPAMGPDRRPLLYQGGGVFASAGPDEFRVVFRPASAGPADGFTLEWIELHSFARRAR